MNIFRDIAIENSKFTSSDVKRLVEILDKEKGDSFANRCVEILMNKFVKPEDIDTKKIFDKCSANDLKYYDDNASRITLDECKYEVLDAYITVKLDVLDKDGNHIRYAYEYIYDVENYVKSNK